MGSAGIDTAELVAAHEPFHRVALLAEACAETGLHDFGGDDFHEPLDRLLTSLESEAHLHPVGRWRVREQVLRLLRGRLMLVAHRRANPEVVGEVIEAPIVVCGSPRAGTSITHQLLATAPGHRAPLAWEFWQPTPPPTVDSQATDPRIQLADDDLRLTTSLSPGLDAVHEYGARLPRECGHALAFSFRTDVFGAHNSIPGYTSWFHGCDMSDAYHWHRVVLQVLQSRMPGDRWVLKAPGHVQFLPALFDEYPDAQVVVCHRDPLAMISSLTSLLSRLRANGSDQVDAARIARAEIDNFLRQFDLLMSWIDDGTVPVDRIIHQRFDEFLLDEVAAVSRIHDHLGLPFSDAHHQALNAWLDNRPRGSRGVHEHSLEGLGLDPEAERIRFSRYIERFSIAKESR